jgi:TolB-like protein/Flp pilus assembly protein TadD
LREAVNLADGEFLSGIDIREPAWEEWLSLERRRLTKLASDASLALGEIEYNESDAAGALTRGEAVIRRDRLREDAHRLIMRSLVKLGRRTEALTHYSEISNYLREELETTPEAATIECYNLIKGATPSSPRTVASPERGQPVSDVTLPAGNSIAVLPFINLSPDPDHEYFADGLTEDLITDLSQAEGLFVIARNSSFTYKGKALDLQRTARDLGVRFVLVGSARRAGQRVRINVQLIDAVAGGHVWAERFDRNMIDIFALQDEVVGRIIEALVGQLVYGRQRERKRTTSIEAYDLCVRGRRLVLQSPEATREARVLFERAIVLDPAYSEAHRWLALGYDVTQTYAGESEYPGRTLALSAAQKAVELDPGDAAAHAMLGTALEPLLRWKEAESEFATALKLNPNSADSWALLSELLVLQGHASQAISAIEKALRLDPHPPGWYHWFLGQAQYLDRQFENAVRTLRNESTYRSQSRRTLAASLAQLGRHEEAHREADLFMASHPHFTIKHWTRAVPFESKAACEFFVDGYRKAGLPE